MLYIPIFKLKFIISQKLIKNEMYIPLIINKYNLEYFLQLQTYSGDMNGGVLRIVLFRIVFSFVPLFL